jgi:hypothetical protein
VAGFSPVGDIMVAQIARILVPVLLISLTGCGDAACVPETSHCEGNVRHMCNTVGKTPIPKASTFDCSKDGEFCIEQGRHSICSPSPDPRPECTGENRGGAFCVNNKVASCSSGAHALTHSTCRSDQVCVNTGTEASRGAICKATTN